MTAAGVHVDTPFVWSGAFDVTTVGNNGSTCSSWTEFAGLGVGYIGNATSVTTEFFLAQVMAACDFSAYRVYCLQR